MKGGVSDRASHPIRVVGQPDGEPRAGGGQQGGVKGHLWPRLTGFFDPIFDPTRLTRCISGTDGGLLDRENDTETSASALGMTEQYSARRLLPTVNSAGNPLIFVRALARWGDGAIPPSECAG
jgi:hypothetical protein